MVAEPLILTLVELAAKHLEPTGVSAEIYGHDGGPGAMPEVELVVGVH